MIDKKQGERHTHEIQSYEHLPRETDKRIDREKKRKNNNDKIRRQEDKKNKRRLRDRDR